MSPHDNEPLTNIPHIVPDRDDVVSYQRQKQGKPKPVERKTETAEKAPKASTGIATPLFALVTLALLGWAGYLHWQLNAAENRVGDLEQRLSLTDESVNQSGVAMQVKLKDLDAALNQIRDETLKHNKAQLGQHDAQLAALDKSMKNAQVALNKIDQHASEQQKTLDGVRAQLDKAAPTIELNKRKLEEQQVSLEAATDKMNRLAAQQTKLESRIGTNEEWVQSINTFRVQTNRELVNLKQQASGGKPPPAEALPR
jgi:DNA repair ATPase RecN